MKKVITIIIALIMIFTFVGCGKPKKGDANGDHKVDYDDIQAIFDYEEGLIDKINVENVDLNEDGKVDTFDAMIIMLDPESYNYEFGKEPEE